MNLFDLLEHDYAKIFKDILVKYNDCFEIVEVEQRKLSSFDSIALSAPASLYRNAVDGIMVARLKNTGKKPYISFRAQYKMWFIKHNIPTYEVKSDTGFFRIELSDFNSIDFSDDDFHKLVVQMCLDTMNYPSFGCCAKYQECSNAGKCLHNDPLYSTACMYRKNLEQGRNFYKTTETNKEYKMDREFRGVSIIDLPVDFTVIDLETTGLDAKYCDIIELAAIKVRNSVVVDKFHSLVHIDEELDPFIVQLTGITDEMLENAPALEDILPKYIDFIGEDIVVGHNVGFDVNFIYDNLYKVNGNYFKNDWINTIRLCKKIYPEFNHYGLGDLVNKLNIETTGSHRALADCETCLKLYEMCRNQVEEKFSSFDDFYSLFKKRRSKRRYIDINSILAQTDSFDETHPLFGQECVFTGKLEKMKRADAMQIVVNLGGTVKNGITNNTNFLVLGNNDFCKSIKDGKSNKHKEAEQLKLQGKDIEIISEQTFYEMLDL